MALPQPVLISFVTETVPILAVNAIPVNSKDVSPTCPHSPSFQNLPPQPFSLKASKLPTEEVADTPVKVKTGLSPVSYTHLTLPTMWYV